MSNINTIQHPCLEHHELVAKLCLPLAQHGVTFFGFTALDTQGNAYCLGSREGYAEQYLLQNCVKDDAHYRPEFISGQHHYYFWDYIRLSEHAERIYQLAAQFDQSHTLTISRFDKDMTRCYHFSGKVADEMLNQRYLQRLDALHAFINYFDNCLQTVPEIGAIFQYPTNLKNQQRLTEAPMSVITTDPRQLILPEHAQSELYLKNLRRYILTEKERACLYWLHRGKSAELIASILNVTRKTVERHIASVKEKYDCYTQFQLGQKIAEIGMSHWLEKSDQDNQ